MTNIAINQFQPDYLVAPGEILLQALEERGMTQTELADRTGRKKKTINEIVKGLAPITSETALQLERVLGVPAHFWANLEQQYRTGLARQKERDRLREKTEWLDHFPVSAMIKREWLPKTSDKVEQLRELLNFFGVAKPEQWHELWEGEAVAYRKSHAFASNPGALAAWLRHGEILARQMECAPFDEKRFRAALADLRKLTGQPPEAFRPEIVRLCTAAGVAVVFVPELPKTRASGATRWLTASKAIIQLSNRYKTSDHLWFTFFHEAGHILLHGKKEVFIDDDGDEGVKEKQANRFASDLLIPPAAYSSFIASPACRSKEGIRTFALRLGIAAGIVAGRLQHDGLLPPSHCNDLKVRLRQS